MATTDRCWAGSGRAADCRRADYPTAIDPNMRTRLGGLLRTKSQRANDGRLGEAISAVARRVGARRAGNDTASLSDLRVNCVRDGRRELSSG